MSPQFPGEEQLPQAIELLKKGGVVAFPTDTLYGLGAALSFDSAVERIYEIKQRPRHLPFPLLLADISDISRVTEQVPAAAWHLARRFLPGGLTLVLPRASWVSPLVTAGGDTVAVRVPAHPLTLALIRGVGEPVIGTSANLSGKPSPVTAEEVRQQLGSRVDLIVDGGRCPGGVGSTVLDLSGATPAILREGAIPREAIAKVLQELSLSLEEKNAPGYRL
jgi:L-threonylcarbamoyladenylate synthase